MRVIGSFFNNQVKIIEPFSQKDERGSFTKTFNLTQLSHLGIEFQVKESYYSVSHQNTLRGMHFQKHEFAHDKIVYINSGEILDVFVDLRHKSPTFKKVESFKLKDNIMIYIPKGFGHGFLTLSLNAIVSYFVSSEYSPEHDSGVLWNSLDFQWPIDNPIISKRDSSFASVEEIKDDLF